MFYRSSLSFVTLHRFLAKITGLGLIKFQRSNSFPDFFSKSLQILTWFFAWRSITMFYRSRLSFVTLHRFLAKLPALKLTGLGLSKFQQWNSFPDIFLKHLPILTRFLACKSITMFYRSSLSFITLHWFLAKLLALKLSNFQHSNSFLDFFPKPLQILTWFWACKSITMT